MRRIARAIQRNPLLTFEPSTKQRVIIESDCPRLLARAANRAGKTEAGAVKSWRFVLDNPGSILLVVAANHKSKIEVVGEKLWLYCPHDEIIDSDWNATRGWKNDVIQLRNGSRIIFRSAESQSTSIAGLTVHACWCDEPMPQHLWGEIMSRVAVHNGPVWITMTPIGRELEWLKLIIEGDPTRGIEPQEDWQQVIIELTTKDCPWRTQESIDNQCASYGPWEYAQRARGAWEGITIDRAFESFTEDNLIERVPQAEWHVGLGMDHGEGAGRETCLLVIWSVPLSRLVVLDEYASSKPTVPEEDAAEIKEMLRTHSMRPHSVDLAYGDSNSAGKMRPGLLVNDLLEPHLQGIHLRAPDKRPGSVDYGTRLINLAMMRGHLLIHPRCLGLLKSVKHWKGKDDDLKHMVDALRYIAVPVLESLYDPATLDRLRMTRA